MEWRQITPDVNNLHSVVTIATTRTATRARDSVALATTSCSITVSRLTSASCWHFVFKVLNNLLHCIVRTFNRTLAIRCTGTTIHCIDRWNGTRCSNSAIAGKWRAIAGRQSRRKSKRIESHDELVVDNNCQLVVDNRSNSTLIVVYFMRGDWLVRGKMVDRW